MALELKQTLKLTQQLVMTPQLQQAIKLLQLNRIELVDLVSAELQENPILDETAEFEDDAEIKKETETLGTEDKGAENADTPDIDWDTYLDTYSNIGYKPARPGNADRTVAGSPCQENSG